MPRTFSTPQPVNDLFELQDGVIARWQALASGVPEHILRHGLRTGSWRAIHPGVYATFSGVLSRRALLWAAVLYASWRGHSPTRDSLLTEPDAVLSHETAAELCGLIDTPSSLIHITVPATRRMPKKRPGIKIHASIRLAETRHPAKTPPCTSVVPTVIDLTQTARTTDDAVGWLTRACGRRLTTPAQLLEVINARKKLRRRHELLCAVGDAAAGDHSLLEVRFHRNVERAHGLPVGIRQRRRVTRSGAEYDDVVYTEFDVVVELDGRMGHEFEGRFRDMRRDNAAALRDEISLRYGWTDSDERACATAAQVAVVLMSRGWTGTPTPCSPDCPIERLVRRAT